MAYPRGIRFPRAVVLSCLCAGLMLAAVGCGRDSGGGNEAVAPGSTDAPPALKSADMPELNLVSFSSARVCGTCHQAIHATWQRSMHSQAWSSPVFQAAYRRGLKAYSPDAMSLCLTCHAPTVCKTQDRAVERPITREGITCDFCHSIRGVDLQAQRCRFDLNVGRTKYGPLKHAQSPVHEVVDSALHRSARLCAGCHEYRNEHGVPILETYSEWLAGPYSKEGKQCQDCHMPIVPGRTVALEVTNAGREGVNLHDISGSHDLERVRRAVTMEILYTTWVGDGRAVARVEVANVGGGHDFPTGLPMHRAVLEVTLTDRGRVVQQHAFRFEKVLLDESGNRVTDEFEAFLGARSIERDTRIKPRERRNVSINFDDVVVSDGVVKASLWYEYSTHTVTSGETGETIEPVRMKFLLASSERGLPRPGP